MNSRSAIAKKIITHSRNYLLMHLRFLDMALFKLNFQNLESIDSAGLVTDGENLYYNEMYVIQIYKAEKNLMARNFLHVVMHCIFNHPFIGEGINKSAWNLACDIVAEHAINELAIVHSNRQAEQTATIQSLKWKVKILTAEKIYRYLLHNPEEADELFSQTAGFFTDDHSLWYPQEESFKEDEGGDDDDNENTSSESSESDEANESETNKISASLEHSAQYNVGLRKETKEAKEWMEIAARIQEDLETFSKNQGDSAKALTQNLLSLTREKYDYSAFLRRFASLSEEMQINDEEFDYIFYTYGLTLYKKMPLIEPLEYKDVLCIKEFIIAIDTSGSVQGSQVQSFVQKTYNILKQSESLATRVNIHIVQCDSSIQDIVKISSVSEIDRYVKNLTIKGLGGTDFRPVFKYVDDQVANGTLTDLKGLIYFTDGYGTFPEYMPNYHAAFVFVEDGELFNMRVPSWAIKLVLAKEDL